MANNKPTTLTTGEVRISYEHLLKPSVNANRPNDEPKYSATLLIPKTDIATKQRMDAAIQAAAQEGMATKWGGVRPPQLAVPIHDGDGVRESGEPYGAECKGHWVVTASSKNRQQVVDLNVQPIIDATQIYSGMYARVSVNFFSYLSQGKKGVGCGLGPVQKTRDGEPLGGYVSPEEAFGSAGFAAPAPGYSQPAYPQQPAQPQYGAPACPQQPQYPAAVPPQQPQGAMPWHTPAYPAQQPAQPQYPAAVPPQQPAAPQQPQYQPQQAPGMIDPITGQPLGNVAGGVMGLQ